MEVLQPALEQLGFAAVKWWCLQSDLIEQFLSSSVPALPSIMNWFSYNSEMMNKILYKIYIMLFLMQPDVLNESTEPEVMSSLMRQNIDPLLYMLPACTWSMETEYFVSLLLPVKWIVLLVVTHFCYETVHLYEFEWVCMRRLVKMHYKTRNYARNGCS